uniref:Uncharacterized protein n=1 Tax=Lactuca sativa TaxID=4236 RepID=A0A9R1WI67_LACSA|nr:hypothetical protein LSAT_V11C200073210 [Lactuca sativa]
MVFFNMNKLVVDYIIYIVLQPLYALEIFLLKFEKRRLHKLYPKKVSVPQTAAEDDLEPTSLCNLLQIFFVSTFRRSSIRNDEVTYEKKICDTSFSKNEEKQQHSFRFQDSTSKNSSILSEFKNSRRKHEEREIFITIFKMYKTFSL